MRSKTLLFVGLVACTLSLPQTFAQQPSDIRLDQFKPLPAPQPRSLLLRQGDRLAICGDSITEQKMYSRLMEDYLTVCEPELNVTVRQYGWGGEWAKGFLARMTNDCLRFKPTIATTCYGMNDHQYRAYDDAIGENYRATSTAVVEAFKANGVRVIVGSPGCVGKVPGWANKPQDSLMDLELNLCHLRDLDIGIAEKEHVGFADVFWPMLNADVAAQKEYGPQYALAGGDGVHPRWAGHTVMAYAFLKAMGLRGDIGLFIVDVKKSKLMASPGHVLVSAKDNEFTIKSSRYPFCACAPAGQAARSYPVCGQDDLASDNSIRSGLTLVPFNQDLNRLILKAENVKTGRTYKVTWGSESKNFTADQLSRGINLAAEFVSNPFSEAFAKVDAAVAVKQAFETEQIKRHFHGADGKADMEGVVAQTEKEREPLAAAIRAAFLPVTHTIKIATAE